MKGNFTLLETLLLLGCLILAVVTIVPGFYQAHIRSNETNAISTLRTLSMAQA